MILIHRGNYKMQLKPEDNEKTPLRMEPETEKQEQEVSYNSEPKYDYNDFGNGYVR